DDPEQQLLISRIKSQLGPDADVEVEDRPLDARVTTRLAATAPVEVVERPRGDVPEKVVALRDTRDKSFRPTDRGVTPPSSGPDAARLSKPALDVAQRAPARREIPAPKGADRPPGPSRGRSEGAADRQDADDEPVTVLVWITARGRTRSGPM
ncbi:MAG TPA: hypothetical protein VF590_15830, partial [Isosphaeraceae bacterium]